MGYCIAQPNERRIQERTTISSVRRFIGVGGVLAGLFLLGVLAGRAAKSSPVAAGSALPRASVSTIAASKVPALRPAVAIPTLRPAPAKRSSELSTGASTPTVGVSATPSTQAATSAPTQTAAESTPSRSLSTTPSTKSSGGRSGGEVVSSGSGG